MARKKNKSKKDSVRIDFSGVETYARMDEGNHRLEVTEVSLEEGEAGDYLKFILQNEDEAKVYHNCSLAKQSLWSTKSFFEALGIEIPDGADDFDFEDMVGKTLTGTIQLETYQGKKRPKLIDFWPDNGKDDKKDKKGKKPDEDAINEMDEDELKEVIEEHKLDVDPDDFPKVKKLRKAVLEALEGDSEEEEEEEEDKKSKKGKKKKGKPSAEEIEEMDQDDLEKLVEEHELEVDLDKYKTLRKMQKAVIEALE